MKPLRTNGTRTEFESFYKECVPGVQWGITHISLPCSCEDGGGPTHWAAIRNTPEALRDYADHEKALRDNYTQDH